MCRCSCSRCYSISFCIETENLAYLSFKLYDFMTEFYLFMRKYRMVQHHRHGYGAVSHASFWCHFNSCYKLNYTNLINIYRQF